MRINSNPTSDFCRKCLGSAFGVYPESSHSSAFLSSWSEASHPCPSVLPGLFPHLPPGPLSVYFPPAVSFLSESELDHVTVLFRAFQGPHPIPDKAEMLVKGCSHTLSTLASLSVCSTITLIWSQQCPLPSNVLSMLLPQNLSSSLSLSLECSSLEYLLG